MIPKILVKPFYKAMSSFSETRKSESLICTDQFLSDGDGITVLKELWMDRSNGDMIEVTFADNGEFIVRNINE